MQIPLLIFCLAAAAMGQTAPGKPAPTKTDTVQADTTVSNTAVSDTALSDAGPLLGPVLPPDSAQIVADSLAEAETVVIPGSEPKEDPMQAAMAESMAVPEPPIRFFSEPVLLAQEWVFGVVGNALLGTLGFYSGKGIESLIEGDDAKKGNLGFQGVRYDNFSGAFYGGAVGIAMGSALGAYFAGAVDEEDGSFGVTLLTGALATAGALAIATAAGANDEFDWVPFVPLLTIPPIGATIGFNWSRWMRDKKRREITGHARAITVEPPRIGLSGSPGLPGGPGFAMQALNLRF